MSSAVDCERWLNELTNKYLVLVSQAYLYGWNHHPHFVAICQEYERLKYGDAKPMFACDKQCSRKRSNRYLLVENLAAFSTDITNVQVSLEKYIKQSEI